MVDVSCTNKVVNALGQEFNLTEAEKSSLKNAIKGAEKKIRAIARKREEGGVEMNPLDMSRLMGEMSTDTRLQFMQDRAMLFAHEYKLQELTKRQDVEQSQISRESIGPASMFPGGRIGKGQLFIINLLEGDGVDSNSSVALDAEILTDQLDRNLTVKLQDQNDVMTVMNDDASQQSILMAQDALYAKDNEALGKFPEEIRKAAKLINDEQDALHGLRISAGIVEPKYTDYFRSQHVDRIALVGDLNIRDKNSPEVTAARDQYASDRIQFYDIHKTPGMAVFTPERLGSKDTSVMDMALDTFRDEWDEIVYGVDIKRKLGARVNNIIPDEGVNLGMKGRKRRHWKLKDGNAAFEWHKRYGKVNALESLQADTRRTAKDIAFASHLGPDPHKMIQDLELNAIKIADEEGDGLTLEGFGERREFYEKQLDGAFRNATGELWVPENDTLAAMVNIARRSVQMFYLGGTALTMTMDPALIAAASNALNERRMGMEAMGTYVEAYATYFKNLTTGWGKKERGEMETMLADFAFAEKLGTTQEMIEQHQFQKINGRRFPIGLKEIGQAFKDQGIMQGVQASVKGAFQATDRGTLLASNLFTKVSGIQRAGRTARFTYAVMMGRQFGRYKGSKFEAMPEILQGHMASAGIKADEWDAIRSEINEADVSGNKFDWIDATTILNLSDGVVTKLLNKQGVENPTTVMLDRERLRMSRGWMGAINTEVRMALAEALPGFQRTLAFGQRPGSVIGAGRDIAMQLRRHPLGFLFQSNYSAIRRIGKHKDVDNNTFLNTAWSARNLMMKRAAALTVVGMTHNALRSVISNEEPEIFSLKAMGAGFVTGGVAPFLGEAIRGDYRNSYGSSALTKFVIGPGGSAMVDVVSSFTSDQKTAKARSAQWMERTPFLNLWYMKLLNREVLSHAFLDELYPDYKQYRRDKAKRMRKYDREPLYGEFAR